MWAGMFAKGHKLEPYFIPCNTTFIYLLTSSLCQRADITKCAALMIDSWRTKHPALSGHFACSCAAFSAINVCGPTIPSNSHTVLLALGVRVGSRLTFNKEPLAC